MTNHLEQTSDSSRCRSLLICPIIACVLIPIATFHSSGATKPQAAERTFTQEIRPLLKEYCFECHGDGAKKGKVSFDDFKSNADLLENKDLWLAVLKNVRAGIMPPAKQPRPAAAAKEKLEHWIKRDVFASNPADPDPGRVTVRRLNRVEYRQTIRDLMGIDFDTEAEFPPDDTGHGFDNIGDVLTISPMLLEKYMDAAKAIVAKAVPVVPWEPPSIKIPGGAFAQTDSTNNPTPSGALNLSYYKQTAASHPFQVGQPGNYQVAFDLSANEKYVDGQFDKNRCRLTLKLDGRVIHSQEYARENGKPIHVEFDQVWTQLNHEAALEIQPLTPDEKQIRSLNLRFDSMTVKGPSDTNAWVRPANYERFFGKGGPNQPKARKAAAASLMTAFAGQASRRPVDSATADRLADLAEIVYSQPGKTFEAGVAQAMVAVLASPRFLFREEFPESAGKGFRPIDEYSLASRLSYFLWSSMPDAELMRLAEKRQLRKNLSAQYRRMLADPKSGALMRNFTGQWLQARDIETIPIDARSVMQREAEPDPEVEVARKRFRELRDKPAEKLTPEEQAELEKNRSVFLKSFGRFSKYELNANLRKDMRRETEKYFEHVVREDRPLMELIEGDYTFLNKRLAEHYELPGIEGDELRLVRLPSGSPRGGILTQGTILAVTSNPTRTSPVKRGVFLLDNILGAPAPPPPPNIPALEEAAKGMANKEPSLRETLAAHREKPMCASCHDRMDPPGLALENFNALGRWRTKERKQVVDPSGKLSSGGDFANIQELKHLLATRHSHAIYECITEKMLTYALGRGLDYRDVEVVDQLVERVEKQGGRPSALLEGIIQSAPFQKIGAPSESDKTVSKTTLANTESRR